MAGVQDDFTERNLELIGSIKLEPMNLDEMVASDRVFAWKFHFADSVWWREVKPFFYQPAEVFTAIVPGEARPRLLAAAGGYYHMVPSGYPANGKIVFNEVRNPAGYDLSAIRHTKRNLIRRGLRTIELKRITSSELLLARGREIYLDWHVRTFGEPPGRSDQGQYTDWVQRLMKHAHELILGAFFEGRLIAWIVARASGERANLIKCYSDFASRKLEAASTLIYAYIRICGQNPAIKSACNGLRSTKPSLEEYKAALGFEHVEYPAYIHLRALWKPLVRRLLPTQYKRLMGEYP